MVFSFSVNVYLMESVVTVLVASDGWGANRAIISEVGSHAFVWDSGRRELINSAIILVVLFPNYPSIIA